MINNQTLEQIKNFLDLEKIIAIQKTTIYILPKKDKEDDDEFFNKLIQVKKELKNVSPYISVEFMKEGEIDNVEQLGFQPESGSNGSQG